MYALFIFQAKIVQILLLKFRLLLLEIHEFNIIELRVN
jgi:hypothetical protein